MNTFSASLAKLFSITSPQIGAVKDSVLVAPDTQTGQTQLPISLKTQTADTVHTLGHFQVSARQELRPRPGFVENVLTKLHTPVSQVVHSNNIVSESLL